MKLCFLTFFLLVPFAAAQEARYSSDSWDNFGSAYSYHLKAITVETKETIVTYINANHQGGRGNDEVNAFWIQESPNCLYFPKGVENIFRNIRGISVTDSGLKSITQDDLRVFPELTNVRFLVNKIATIDSKLFAFNPKLNHMDFRENRIRSISPDVFDDLVKLEHAWFDANVCPLRHANGRGELRELEKQILERCDKGPRTARNQVASADNNQVLIDEIALLKMMFTKQQNEIDRIRKDVDDLTTFK